MKLPKPEKCKGCPFYGDGIGFVPDRLNEQADVFVYGQNPGADEENGLRWDGTDHVPYKVEPFTGKTGYELSSYLTSAGSSREEVSLGNAIRCRVKNSNDLPQIGNTDTQAALLHCHLNHFRLPSATKLFVTQGDYALFALTGHGKDKNDHIGDWRGYLLPFQPIGSSWVFHNDIWHPLLNKELPVLATYHLAFLHRDPTISLIMRHDFTKIHKVLEGSWPSTLPTIYDGPPPRWPLNSAFDTEYNPITKQFICYSLYDGMKLRVSEELNTGIISSDDNPHVIMHNAPADLDYLERMFTQIPFSYDDTVHGHAVLWSDFPHDLGFLGSLYAPINRWKHLMQLNPRVYSAADAFVTWHSWEELKKEFKRDPKSWWIYLNAQLPLVPIIRQSEARGIKINQGRAAEHYDEYHIKNQALLAEAQAVVGWPINLRSNDQVKHELFKLENVLGQKWNY